MTRVEWLRLVGRMQRIWPNQVLADDTVAEWYRLLDDLDATAAEAAVNVIARGGREFVPPPGLIRSKAAELAGPGVTFDQAWGQIQRAVAALGRYQPVAAQEALRRVPFALDLVALMGGWEAVCNAGPDENRPVDPGVWRASAEHAFKALQTQRRDDEAAAGLEGPRGAAARSRLAGDLVPVAAIEVPQAPPLPEPAPTEALAAVPRRPLELGSPPEPHHRPLMPAPRRLALPAASGGNGNGLKPEYRAEIERLIREGQEARVPERWRPYVHEIKAALSTATAHIPQPEED